MSVTVTPTQDDMFIALRAFILTLIDCEVVQGLGNRVPMPPNPFICMTTIGQRAQATNVLVYDTAGNEQSILRSTEYRIQIDCYGPQSSDWATTVSTMFRDLYACTLLAPNCQPLYASDPTQAPLIDGEENYEQRWTFAALLQFNPVITVPQEFADLLDVNLVNVEATYPPT